MIGQNIRFTTCLGGFSNSNRLRRYERGAPGGLKVESSGFTVNVQYLTRKINPPGLFALHCFDIDILQINATTGNKFFFICGLTLDREGATNQELDQPVEILVRQFRPDLVVINSGKVTNT